MAHIGAVLLALVVLAGCGGEKAKRLTSPKASATATAAPTDEKPTSTPKQVTREETAAIKGWADALRHGHLERAVRYWDIPSVAANGTDPLRLESVGDVRVFNQALPCGAKLESTERDGIYVVATFVLTERPGPGTCGSGTGERARTEFLIRHGKIKAWLRAPDPAESAGESS
jgi:hypothetical protein